MSNAQAVTPQWWEPDGGEDKWHLRIPFSVSNTRTLDLLDASVGRDIDIRTALLDVGWPSSGQGKGKTLQSFEFDPHSVRVVEYRSIGTGKPTDGFLAASPEVPSVVHLTAFDGLLPYDARTNPLIHVDWLMPGVTPAGATRYFLVYFDVIANGEKSSAEYPSPALEKIESRRWIGRGTTLIGFATTLKVWGLEDDTSVTLETYFNGRPAPMPVSVGSPFSNPLKLNKDETIEVPVSQAPTLMRLRSDKPIVASGPIAVDPSEPNKLGSLGPVPSLDGSLLGKSFVTSSPVGFLVVAPSGSANVRVLLDGLVEKEVTLSPSVPARAVSVFENEGEIAYPNARIESDSPIFVFMWPSGGKVQYPTIHGAPSGSTILASHNRGGVYSLCGSNPVGPCYQHSQPCATSKVGRAAGELLVGSLESQAFFRIREQANSKLIYPLDALNQPAQTSASASPDEAERVAYTSAQPMCPLLVQSTASQGTQAVPGNLVVFGGSSLLSNGQPPLRTALGGDSDATRFLSYWNVEVVALHDGTTLLAQQGGTTRSAGLAAGYSFRFDGSRFDPLLLKSDKPVVVWPRDTPGGFFAGIDDSLSPVQAGPATYRGHLISLEPAGESSEPMIGLAGPGKPVTFRFNVRNLGLDDSGRGLPDVVQLGLPALLEGWVAELSEPTVRLGPGESREVTLSIAPPADAADGASITVGLTATSQGNPQMGDRVQTITLVRARYGVDLWFEKAGGAKTQTIVLDPGASKDVRIVMKNLATISDRIGLTGTILSPDWSATFLGTQRRLAEVTLEPGQVATFDLRIQAPATAAGQTLLEVTATSASDSTAAAKIGASLRVRADVRIALEAEALVSEAPPGQAAKFRVVFHNRGSDTVGIHFQVKGALPEGWERPGTFYDVHPIEELEGLAPGSSTPLDIVAPIPADALRTDRAALHFEVRTLPQFVGDVPLEESLDLLAMAGPRHDLRVLAGEGATLVTDLSMRVAARIDLANHGNGDEQLTLVPLQVPEQAVILMDQPRPLPMGSEGGFGFTLQLPGSMPPGVHPVTAAVVTDTGHPVPWSFNVSVPERTQAELKLLGPAASVTGVPTDVRVEIVNSGNLPLAIPPVLDAPEGWTLTWSGEPGSLLPGAQTERVLTVQSPRADTAPSARLEPAPTWAFAQGIEWEVYTIDLRASLTRDPAALTVTLENDGTASLSGLTVILMRGESEIDRQVVRRLGPGSPVPVRLVPDAAEGDLRVLVDPARDYLETPLQMAVPPVEVDATPLPFLLPLAALLAVLVGRGRRR